MNYASIVQKTLTNLKVSFQHDELAYLALTSKIEHPIRDRLAFELYKQLHQNNIVVAREWNKADLCLLYQQTPVLICELKAAYSFDLLNNNINNYLGKIKADINKSKVLAANDSTEIMAIFLITHVYKEIHGDFVKVIKYHKDINSAFKVHLSQEKLISEAVQALKNKFYEFSIAFGKIGGGNSFGYDVDVHYFCLKENGS